MYKSYGIALSLELKKLINNKHWHDDECPFLQRILFCLETSSFTHIQTGGKDIILFSYLLLE